MATVEIWTNLINMDVLHIRVYFVTVLANTGFMNIDSKTIKKHIKNNIFDIFTHAKDS